MKHLYIYVWGKIGLCWAKDKSEAANKIFFHTAELIPFCAIKRVL